KHPIVGHMQRFLSALPLLVLLIPSYISGSRIGKNLNMMKNLMLIGLVLMTISFAGLVLFKKLALFLAVLAVSSIGAGLILPCVNSLITGSVSKNRRGFVTSL